MPEFSAGSSVAFTAGVDMGDGSAEVRGDRENRSSPEFSAGSSVAFTAGVDMGDVSAEVRGERKNRSSPRSSIFS